MRSHTPRLVLGAAGVTAATAAGSALSLWLAVPPLLRLTAAGSDPVGGTAAPPDAGDVAELLHAGAAAALLLCTSWWAVLTVVTVVEAMAGISSHRGGRSPRGVRRAVRLLLGVAVGSASLTLPSAAAHDGVRAPTALCPVAALGGLPLPDRQVGHVVAGGTGATPRRARRAVTSPSPPPTLRVRRGDTLWSLATGLLPPGAAPSLVDHTWRLVHRSNRVVIGTDPDVILPGMRLRVPAALPGTPPASDDRP